PPPLRLSPSSSTTLFRSETLFYLNAPSSVLEALMFLLSFPLGDALMFLFHSAQHDIIERFVFWALAMGIGYVQWFHLFPALLRQDRKSTRLNSSHRTISY